MILDIIQKAVLYLKEMLEFGLYGVMADSRLLALFNSSPLFYVMFPLMGFLLGISALINGYRLFRSSNKNFDKWFECMITGICAVLANTSLLGTIIASALGSTFIMGPWLFLGGILLAMVHQVLMATLNTYRAFESPEGSNQRKHYIQAALYHVFISGLLLAISGAVVFALIFPAALPALATVFAVTAALLIAVNALWRMTPYKWKLAIKGCFALGKTQLEDAQLSDSYANLKQKKDSREHIPPVHNRLFTVIDYSTQIQLMDEEGGRDYLKNIIDIKIKKLSLNNLNKNDKTDQKLAVLLHLKQVISQGDAIVTRKELLTRYPLAFQSFWNDKGDIEHIFNACGVLQNPIMNDNSIGKTGCGYSSRLTTA